MKTQIEGLLRRCFCTMQGDPSQCDANADCIYTGPAIVPLPWAPTQLLMHICVERRERCIPLTLHQLDKHLPTSTTTIWWFHGTK